jgi:hypothetical protein
MDGGVEATFAPELFRTDRVSIGEDGAAVHVGQTVIHFADDAYITPGEARKLAEALWSWPTAPTTREATARRAAAPTVYRAGFVLQPCRLECPWLWTGFSKDGV